MQGSKVRLQRIFRRNGRTIILPTDDALIKGPTGLLTNLSGLYEEDAIKHVDAVLGFIGSISRLPSEIDAARIANLTASTIRSAHTRKVRVGSVKGALRVASDAIAVHVNLTSKYENEMVDNLGVLIDQAADFDVPVFAIVYPRGEANDGKDENYLDMKASDPDAYFELSAHCVRFAVEMGADIVKTVYPGSQEYMRRLVDAALGVPLVIAGGDVLSEESALSMAKDALLGGARGISYGRNIHQADRDPKSLLTALARTI